MEPKATIVMPTLNWDRGVQTCRLAKMTAGVECDVILLWDYKARGAVRLNNALFKAAMHLETPYIVYLNDDTIPEQQGWLKLLIKGLEQNPKYGMACPAGECSTTPQKSGRPGDAFKVHVVRGPLAWFCAAVKREVFKTVGWFDEGFIHYGDESDYVQRAIRKGWKQIYVQGVYIKHLRGAGGEYKALRNQWAKKDKRRYRRKWVKKPKGGIGGGQDGK